MARLMSILYMYKTKFKPFKYPIDIYIPSYRIFIISKSFLYKHHLSINYDIYKVHNKVLHMMLTFKILLVLGLMIPYLTYNVFYEISLGTNPLSHINSF